MKLDNRIVDRKYIFDCFNADKAKEFIGEDCYMTNDIELFKDLDRVNAYTLDKIEDGFYNAEEDEYFDFCLPIRWLKSEEKEKEKQYRPYTLNEFKDKFHIGQPISFRKTGEVGNERYLILNGYSNYKLFDETTTDIYIGRGAYTLDELFSKYEWQASDTEEFKPFGVEK